MFSSRILLKCFLKSNMNPNNIFTVRITVINGYDTSCCKYLGFKSYTTKEEVIDIEKILMENKCSKVKGTFLFINESSYIGYASYI